MEWPAGRRRPVETAAAPQTWHKSHGPIGCWPQLLHSPVLRKSRSMMSCHVQATQRDENSADERRGDRPRQRRAVILLYEPGQPPGQANFAPLTYYFSSARADISALSFNICLWSPFRSLFSFIPFSSRSVLECPILFNGIFSFTDITCSLSFLLSCLLCSVFLPIPFSSLLSLLSISPSLSHTHLFLIMLNSEHQACSGAVSDSGTGCSERDSEEVNCFCRGGGVQGQTRRGVTRSAGHNNSVRSPPDTSPETRHSQGDQTLPEGRRRRQNDLSRPLPTSTPWGNKATRGEEFLSRDKDRRLLLF